MSEKAKLPTPPYTTFTSFMGFINKLKETQVPSRIDATVFRGASGSLVYSVLSALKSLNLINAEGIPSSQFVDLVMADEEDRKRQMRAIMEIAYAPLFGSSFNLASATAGQFDELIRREYDAKGSTVDKVATFFIAAAKYADIEISQHLAARKPTASSASSNKSKRQRKAETGGEDPPPPPPGSPQITEKALEYRLVDLMSEAAGDADVMQAIITVITFLKTKSATKKATDE